MNQQYNRVYNFWTRVLLVLALIVSISRGASTINWEFDPIYRDIATGGNEFANGMAVYLFVSIDGIAPNMNNLATSLVGVDLNQGSTFDSGDKVILGLGLVSGSLGPAGTGNDVAVFNYIAGMGAGDRLGILFINQADGPIVANTKFGVYLSSGIPSLTLAADNSITSSFFSVPTVPSGTFVTTHITLIPEPSTLLLSSLGVLALLRRRR